MWLEITLLQNSSSEWKMKMTLISLKIIRLYYCQKNPLFLLHTNFLKKLKKSEEKDHKWMNIEIHVWRKLVSRWRNAIMDSDAYECSTLHSWMRELSIRKSTTKGKAARSPVFRSQKISIRPTKQIDKSVDLHRLYIVLSTRTLLLKWVTTFFFFFQRVSSRSEFWSSFVLFPSKIQSIDRERDPSFLYIQSFLCRSCDLVCEIFV